MSQRMNDRLFVERRFDLGNHEVIARFYAPILAPGGEYQCRWCIQWPDRDQERYACGIDGLQALTLAMRVVHAKLFESAEYQAGTLTYLDQQDLDLPPAWGPEPRCQTNPKVG